MSSNIQGSKSLNYNKIAIPGYSPEQGTSIDSTSDTMQHLSIQEISGKRGAADVVIHGTTLVSTGHIIEAGSAQRLIRSTAHGAKVGWVMRPIDGASATQEISIVGIIDANNFAISTLFPLAIADTFDLLRYVTPKYTADGDLNVVVAQGPLIYLRNAANEQVEEDTSVTANNRPLPTKLFTSAGVPIDPATSGAQGTGNSSLSSIDGKTPALGQALDAASVPVVLTASQLTTITPPAAITGFATSAKQDSLLAELELKANLSETQPVSNAGITSIDGKTPALGQALDAASVPVVLTAAQITTLTPPAAIAGFALESTQSSGNTLLGAVTEIAPASDTASSGLNGRLQRIAQRLTSLIGLFPTALGAGISSTAFRVVLASDQAAIAARDPVNVTGTVVNTLLTAITASLASAPASTSGFILQAPSSNTDSIRFAIGTTASTTVGMLLEPGRDTGYLPIGANISVCATVSGTNEFALQWIGA